MLQGASAAAGAAALPTNYALTGVVEALAHEEKACAAAREEKNKGQTLMVQIAKAEADLDGLGREVCSCAMILTILRFDNIMVVHARGFMFRGLCAPALD